jgi:hypothetical protein
VSKAAIRATQGSAKSKSSLEVGTRTTHKPSQNEDELILAQAVGTLAVTGGGGELRLATVSGASPFVSSITRPF